jgi:hypothetical protein
MMEVGFKVSGDLVEPKS